MPQTVEQKRLYAQERRRLHGDRLRAKQAEWAGKNREHLKRRGEKRRLEKRAMCLVAHARIRARRLQLPFDLDQYIPELQKRIDLGVCELTGFPFDLKGGKRQYASPSIDRIEPCLGYTFPNVRVICYGMNAALGNWGEDALMQMIESWLATRSASRSRRRS